MRLLHTFPFFAFLLVLTSITGLCIAQDNMPLLMVAGTLALTSWFITEGPRGRSLPKWVTNILVLAAALNGVIEFSQNIDDRWGVLGRFTVWLILIKLYERKAPRDYAQLMMLSFLLMLTGCLLSTEMAFGITLLVYGGLGLYVLLLYQLHASYEHGKADRLAAVPRDYRLAPTLRPIISRNVGWHFRSLVAAVGAGGFLLSVLVFVTIPRDVGLNLVSGLQLLRPERMAGFGDTIDLVAGTRISDSARPVFTVTLRDRAGRPYAAAAPLHLRGAVMEDYVGHGVWRSDPGNIRTYVSATGALEGRLRPDLPVITQEIEMLEPAPTLFSVAWPHRVETTPPCELVVNPATATIAPGRTCGPVLRYTIVAQPAAPPYLVDLPGGRRSRLLRGEVERLCRLLLEQDDVAQQPPADPGARSRWTREAVGAFARHLRSQEFRYTLDLSDVVNRNPGENDPIVQFLFETRRGHCEYFASALAAMSVNVGIPARVVAGYLVQEYDAAAGRYVVRDRNAHAWVEVHAGTEGWLMYDPTPPAAIRDIVAPQPGLADRADWIYRHNVVQFDGVSQQRLARAMDFALIRRIADLAQALRRWASDQAFYFGVTGYIWIGTVMLAFVIAVIAFWQHVRRARTMRRSLHLEHFGGLQYHRLLLQLRFYMEMLRVLHRGGLEKPVWQPPLRFAESIAADHPEVARNVSRLTELFYEVRYAGRRLTREDALEARSLVEELARLLKVHA